MSGNSLDDRLERFLDGNGLLHRSKSSLDDNDHNFTSYFTINIQNTKSVECPLFCLRHVEQVVNKVIFDKLCCNKVIIPIDVTPRYLPVEGASVSTVFKRLFNICYCEDLRFEKAAFKDESFYGGMATILDETLYPLFMLTATVDFFNYRILKINARVSPRVYLQKNKLNKGIMSKLIPYYLGKHYPTNLKLVSFDTNYVSVGVLFESIPFVINYCNMDLPSQQPYTVLQERIDKLIDSLDYVN